MNAERPLGLGFVGAGAFAQFVASVAAEFPDVVVAAVADTDPARAQRLAAVTDAAASDNLAALLDRGDVDAVVIATPPRFHADLAVQAMRAGRHVFCEKPIALTVADADRVRGAVDASGRAFVVDHVLRYNPILAAIRRLQDDGLLAAVQRLSFDNDAADEDLPARHWFWNESISGGILLEHGVHFFDAGAMLLGAPACRVQTIASGRPDGRIDTVVCTVAHADGALATYAHGFSHAHRAERQLMRLDCGLAEVRIHGWIPLRADLDLWADEDVTASYEQLAHRASEVLVVAGGRSVGGERISVDVERDAAPAQTHARGIAHRAPHHITARLEVAGPNAKDRVYRESVRCALGDLVASARTGARPRADIIAGYGAVRLAAAATAAWHDTTTHHLSMPEAS